MSNVTSLRVTYDFWNIIEQLDWKGKCVSEDRPYNVTKQQLVDICHKDVILVNDIAETARAYRRVLADKIQQYSLDNFNNRYKYPLISDDSFWDLTAHIVGCGKEAYEKACNHPETIARDYVDNHNYKENFEYTFNGIDKLIEQSN